LKARRAAEPRPPSLGEVPSAPELPGFVIPVVTASGLWPPTDEDLNLGPRPQPPRQEDLDNPPQYLPPVRIVREALWNPSQRWRVNSETTF
jgi:hypothetical protein